MKKYIIHGVYIVIISAIVFFGWRAYKDLTAQFENQQISFKQLSDSLVRAESEMVTKAELNGWAKSMDIDLGKIKRDLSKLGADLVAVGTTVASIESKIEEDVGSDNSEPHEPPEQPTECKLCDTHGYTASKESKDIVIGEMPHAKATFDASKKNPWTLKYDTIDVVVDTAVGKFDIEGIPLVFYHTISLFNKTRPSLKGKIFKLRITESAFKQTTEIDNKFRFWDPHLDLGLTNTVAFLNDEVEYRPGVDLGFSAMSYGKTNRNIIRLLRLGVGINAEKAGYLLFEPAKYNLGNHLPLISDLYLGAGVSIDTDAAWGVGFTLGTTL